MSPVRLQVTVMIAAFVVATISSTAATSPFSPMSTAFPHETTSTPKPPPTTSSSQCWRDGQLVEGLEPGGSMQKDCEFCECFDGEVFCCYVGCGPAMCWDSLLSECCRSCPNGNNCKTPSGTIIQEGETVTENGMTCTCTMDNVWESWDWDLSSEDGPVAQCFPATTTPPPITTPPPTTTPQLFTLAADTPPPCQLRNGSYVKGLEPGSSVQVGCSIYQCTADGQVMELLDDCFLAPTLCVDSVPGECCRTCPNGQNCRTPSGKIIKDGETVTENGMTCTCSLDNWWDNWDWDQDPLAGPQAQCGSETVTPPPAIHVSLSMLAPSPIDLPPSTIPKSMTPRERRRLRKILRLKRKLIKFGHMLHIKQKRKLRRQLRKLQSRG